ncbi:hypothetical protein SUGI_1045290 [Cryptomeria japonica]|uniref:uncharacterized protein LOC131067562 n=1 Tax=Cryptomeria japonica TaxID=3369 RepID=UPI002414A405|nr:uncharacterized protein LOC131067562 [Cryptomeria japonica]GLJ49396.1 hypothetical protein SUGI_1045290 [Cryptomeria japonica]
MAALSCLPALFSSITPTRSRSSTSTSTTLLNARPLTFHRKRMMPGPCARLGGGEGGGSNEGEKKKFITKEQEPEQYWQTAAERDGVNPMSTPLPYIVIFGFLTPFIILGVAFANGWIKVPVR